MVKKIPVIAINTITNKIHFYESISDAARNCGCCEKSIYNVLHGCCSQVGLFTFKYADKLKPINNGNKKN